MFDIPFHINLFISLIEPERTLLYQFLSSIEVEHPLKTLNKRTNIALPTISLVEVEHPLKTSNKRTHV